MVVYGSGVCGLVVYTQSVLTLSLPVCVCVFMSVCVICITCSTLELWESFTKKRDIHQSKGILAPIFDLLQILAQKEKIKRLY